MILQTGTSNEVFGIQNQSEFKIKASAHAFRILSDGLYSDKISSIIRELSCNAYDSHVLKGTQDKPFNIMLPNDLSPFFSVRDYGVGLSEEDIYNLYSTYFESTKGSSNDFIGALGLGSKSPFSYTDSFTVDSYFDGMLKSYCIFIGETGVPTIAKTYEEPTLEPTGLKITLEVKKGDYREFINKAELLSEFNPRPECNINIFERKNYKVFESNDLYEIRDGNGKVFIKQGAVLYPIKNEYLDKFPLIRGTNLIVKANIGTISFTASREDISYDIQTIEEIKSLLEKVTEDYKTMIPRQLSELLAKYPFFEAVREFFKLPFHDISYTFAQQIIVYKDISLYDFYSFDTSFLFGGYKEIQTILSIYRGYKSNIKRDMYESFNLKYSYKLYIEDKKPTKQEFLDVIADNIYINVSPILAEELVKNNMFKESDIIYGSSLIQKREKTEKIKLQTAQSTREFKVSEYNISDTGYVYTKTLSITKDEFLKIDKGYFITQDQDGLLSNNIIEFILKSFGNNESLYVLNKTLHVCNKSLLPLKSIIEPNIKEISNFIYLYYSSYQSTKQFIFSVLMEERFKKLISKTIPEVKDIVIPKKYSTHNQNVGDFNTFYGQDVLSYTGKDEVYTNIINVFDKIIKMFPLLNHFSYSSLYMDDLYIYMDAKRKLIKN